MREQGLKKGAEPTKKKPLSEEKSPLTNDCIFGGKAPISYLLFHIHSANFAAAQFGIKVADILPYFFFALFAEVGEIGNRVQ